MLLWTKAFVQTFLQNVVPMIKKLSWFSLFKLICSRNEILSFQCYNNHLSQSSISFFIKVVYYIRSRFSCFVWFHPTELWIKKTFCESWSFRFKKLNQWFTYYVASGRYRKKSWISKINVNSSFLPMWIIKESFMTLHAQKQLPKMLSSS